MATILSADEWAKEQFSGCDLGDKRRKKRLIEIATALCSRIGKSLSHCCQGDSALREGGYRFIRNDMVKASEIAQGIFTATYNKAQGREVLLAIEDTTTTSYTHEVDGLGDTGGPINSMTRGFHAHSILMVDGQTKETLGLIAQTRWIRNEEERGKSYKREERAYEEKESFKWEKSSRQLAKRMQSGMSKVISVCDREADLYQYLSYKINNGQRFIIRSSQDRKLYEELGDSLQDAIESAEILGEYPIPILQKGGRKSRTATLCLKSCHVEIAPPKRLSGTLNPLELNVVIATELDNKETEENLSWVLLTKEDVNNFVQARKVVEYYETRWRIEEFHKAWKSGAGVEAQRMQSADNIERMAVILSAIAVRLLQLKEGLEREELNNTENIPCRQVLSEDEFIVLWFAIQPKKGKKKRIPTQIPSLGWAYKAIAKLGGWADTKHLGRASWSTIWDGWFCLQERLAGYLVAKEVAEM